MEAQEFLDKIDQLYAEKHFEMVEKYMLEVLEDAKADNNYSLWLLADNELAGHYRSIGDFDNAVGCAMNAKKLFELLNLKDSIHYATTLLNLATALRGKKEYDESIELYNEAEKLYEKYLDDNDYRYAGLYNNMSTIYEKKAQYDTAKEYLWKAINIIKSIPNTNIELATSYVNLAEVEFLDGENEAAKKHLNQAISIFEENNACGNMHYSAALASLGQLYYLEKEYDLSEEYYVKAMDLLESIVGKNDYYYDLKDNLSLVRKTKEENNKEIQE